MRKSFYLFLLAALTAVASLNAQNRDWANLKRYSNANAELVNSISGIPRVVFMGNSITEGWVNNHPDFFKSNGYIGRGISGQTSSQFLLRFRQDVVSLKPKLVIINAGTNDVAENTGPYSEEQTFGNIVSMVEIAQANKIKVILTSTLPAASFGWNKKITDAADKIALLNARIRQYAKKHKIPYVDYYSSMVSGTERALNPAYTKDGVHPTSEGYDIMEALIQKAIQKELRSSH
ncbi:MAG: SGNH/GDSL hydrolase family protein [Bacteroides intestinalis]|nr:SGNH/GDSL hydrolase family protein [Bacteroides intestinalis]